MPETDPTTGSPPADPLDGSLASAALDGLEGRVAVLDGDGTLLLANRAWRHAPSDDGTVANARFNPGDSYPGALEAAGAGPGGAGVVARALRTVLKGLRDSYEVELSVGRSPERWFAVRVSSVRLPAGRGAMVVQREITHRKRSEERLTAARTLLEQHEGIFDSAVVGIALLDLRGQALAINPYLLELLEMDTSEVPELAFSTRIHGGELQKYQSLFRSLIGGSADRCDAEVRLLRKGGGYFWAHMTLSLVRDAPGAPRNVVAMVDDITERKGLEEQLRLSQRIESIGRLAGGIAHDFNNLITVISGHAGLVLDRLAPDDPLRIELERIREAGDRAAALTGQLLAFSRRQVLQPRPVGLDQVVGDTESMLGRIIGEDIDLVVEAAPDLGIVRADPGQLQQVVINLAVNARDAMPRGGQLVLRMRNVDLDEDFVRTHMGSSEGPHVLLEVHDTGEGMDEEVRSKAFEPFFTTKEPGKGTGLGLAMVYGIVKQSGGYIALESERGVGTLVKLYLPRIEGEGVRQDVTPDQRIEEDGGHETILLVEDEEMVRSLASRVLEKKGYSVLVAADGADALDIACRESIDLLVTDVIMPRLGGGELAERLLELRPGIRVLFISGYTDDAIVRHGVLDRDRGFLQKPFTADALTRKVRSVLDGSRRAG